MDNYPYKNIFVSTSPHATESFAKSFAAKCGPGSIIALEGTLGVGKTVFAKGLAKGLNINTPITSPTFTIIQEYSGILPFYHMDLYRIENYEEFELAGGIDLLYGKGVTLIEWSEKISSELPEYTKFISIQLQPDNSRNIYY